MSDEEIVLTSDEVENFIKLKKRYSQEYYVSRGITFKRAVTRLVEQAVGRALYKPPDLVLKSFHVNQHGFSVHFRWGSFGEEIRMKLRHSEDPRLSNLRSHVQKVLGEIVKSKLVNLTLEVKEDEDASSTSE